MSHLSTHAICCILIIIIIIIVTSLVPLNLPHSHAYVTCPIPTGLHLSQPLQPVTLAAAIASAPTLIMTMPPRRR